MDYSNDFGIEEPERNSISVREFASGFRYEAELDLATQLRDIIDYEWDNEQRYIEFLKESKRMSRNGKEKIRTKRKSSKGEKETDRTQSLVKRAKKDKDEVPSIISEARRVRVETVCASNQYADKHNWYRETVPFLVGEMPPNLPRILSVENLNSLTKAQMDTYCLGMTFTRVRPRWRPETHWLSFCVSVVFTSEV